MVSRLVEDFSLIAVICQLDGKITLIRETGGKKSRSPLEILNFPSFLFLLFFFVWPIVVLLSINLPLQKTAVLGIHSGLVLIRRS